MGGIMRAAELTDDTRLARTGRFGEDGGAEDATQACRHETIKFALKIVTDGQILSDDAPNLEHNQGRWPIWYHIHVNTPNLEHDQPILSTDGQIWPPRRVDTPNLENIPNQLVY